MIFVYFSVEAAMILQNSRCWKYVIRAFFWANMIYLVALSVIALVKFREISTRLFCKNFVWMLCRLSSDLILVLFVSCGALITRAVRKQRVHT